jgi:probable HAF family extracellular repeat protein
MPSLTCAFRKQRGLHPLGIVAALVCLGALPAHAGSVFFTVTDLNALLPVPAGSQATSIATAINNAGQITGTFIDAAGGRTGFVYSGGTVTPLMVAGVDTTYPNALTDAIGPSGQVQIVGTSRAAGVPSFLATMGSAGQQTAVGIGDDTTSATGINAAGQVVGQSSFGGSYQAFLRNTDGVINPLGTLGGSFSYAAAINDAGQVVGRSARTSGPAHAFLYSGGQMTDLGALSAKDESDAVAINQQGAVVGSSRGSDGTSRAFLYRNGRMVDITPGVTASVANGINNSLQVVGSLDAGGTAPAGFIYSPSGRAVDLNGFLRNANGIQVLDAIAINERGQIAALSVDRRALLLTPQGLLQWSATKGGTWDDGGNWDSGLGFTPQPSLDVAIAPYMAQGVALETNAQVKSLILGGGRGDVSLRLARGAVLTTADGLHVQTSGMLLGNGVVVGKVINEGRVLAGGIDGLRFSAGRFENQNTGRLQIEGGKLNFSNGLLNAGQVQLGSGNSQLSGKFVNAAQGRILATGNFTTQIEGPLTNDGDVNAVDGARIVYQGPVLGAGSFSTAGAAALHHFMNRFSPTQLGLPAQMGNSRFSGSLALDIGGVELRRTAGKSTSTSLALINFTGSVMFDGSAVLDVSWPFADSPQLGQSFDLFDFTQTAQGQFGELKLPALATGLVWDTSDLYLGGELRVAAVPEPATWVLMLVGVAAFLARRRIDESRS